MPSANPPPCTVSPLYVLLLVTLPSLSISYEPLPSLALLLKPLLESDLNVENSTWCSCYCNICFCQWITHTANNFLDLLRCPQQVRGLLQHARVTNLTLSLLCRRHRGAIQKLCIYLVLKSFYNMLVNMNKYVGLFNSSYMCLYKNTHIFFPLTLFPLGWNVNGLKKIKVRLDGGDTCF